MAYNFRNWLLLFMGISIVQVSAADDYPFGRLFTAESERKQLDRIREMGVVEQQEAPVKPLAPVLQPMDETTTRVQFSGYVTRKDGSTILWIDGASDLSKTGAASTQSHLHSTTGQATFKTADKEQTLKPGQTWLIESNTVAEVYEQTSPPTPVTTEDGQSAQPVVTN